MPLYQAAANRGIAAVELDRCSLYEVRWMLETPEPLGGEGADDYRARVAEAVAARERGEELAYEPFDMTAVAGAL